MTKYIRYHFLYTWAYTWAHSYTICFVLGWRSGFVLTGATGGYFGRSVTSVSGVQLGQLRIENFQGQLARFLHFFALENALEML